VRRPRGKPIKIVATRCHVLKLNAPNSISTGGTYSAPPNPLPGFKGRKDGREGQGRGEERGGDLLLRRQGEERRGGRKGEGTVSPQT